MKVCEKYQGLLSAWVLGDVEGSDLQEVTRHLQGCPSCQRESEEIRALLDDLKAIHVPEAGDLFFQRQLHKIQEQVRQEKVPSPGFRKIWWVPLAAAAVIAFFVFGIRQLDHRPMVGQALDWNSALQFLAKENDVTPTLEDLEELSPQQLQLLANNLEKKILLEEGESWGQDTGDWEDLTGPELDSLINKLQANTSGRRT